MRVLVECAGLDCHQLLLSFRSVLTIVSMVTSLWAIYYYRNTDRIQQEHVLLKDGLMEQLILIVCQTKQYSYRMVSWVSLFKPITEMQQANLMQYASQPSLQPFWMDKSIYL
jgi:hypothetical protein